MDCLKRLARIASTLACALGALSAWAADYPAPREASWVARDFRFHTGEVMPQLQLHYRTIGTPTGEAILVLHGTTQSGASMLTPAFAGELFGPGQPLDASRYYVIIPDTLGHGKSSKPSDGLRAKFPKYQPGQTCANCALYVGEPGQAHGGCSLFYGKDVVAKGWCSAWEKKPR